jgi:hypothetical protein
MIYEEPFGCLYMPSKSVQRRRHVLTNVNVSEFTFTRVPWNRMHFESKTAMISYVFSVREYTISNPSQHVTSRLHIQLSYVNSENSVCSLFKPTMPQIHFIVVLKVQNHSYHLWYIMENFSLFLWSYFLVTIRSSRKNICEVRRSCCPIWTSPRIVSLYRSIFFLLHHV